MFDIITNKHLIAPGMEAHIAHIIYRDIHLFAAYDCIKSELHVHGWHRVPRDEYDALHAAISTYFESL